MTQNGDGPERRGAGPSGYLGCCTPVGQRATPKAVGKWAVGLIFLNSRGRLFEENPGGGEQILRQGSPRSSRICGMSNCPAPTTSLAPKSGSTIRTGKRTTPGGVRTGGCLVHIEPSRKETRKTGLVYWNTASSTSFLCSVADGHPVDMERLSKPHPNLLPCGVPESLGRV
jgi:hypothetical protein